MGVLIWDISGTDEEENPAVTSPQNARTDDTFDKYDITHTETTPPTEKGPPSGTGEYITPALQEIETEKPEKPLPPPGTVFAPDFDL
ncbi:MAG: hypothetical protein KDI13_09290 [Alphaproteobacteria bacterium]|nr:hypothetical protein [Alphaproteobacteria bacterium]